MVIDEVNDQKFPRYLVYDVIQFEGQERCLIKITVC